MQVKGKNYRTVWLKDSSVFLIDQTLLPFEFKIYQSKNHFDTARAIKNMNVRGAPAIEGAAGFAMAQAFLEAPGAGFWRYVDKARETIEATRPTARNLFYATSRVFTSAKKSGNPRVAAVAEAQKIAQESVKACKKIGEYGSRLIKDGCRIETHCNAGWLASVDYGTALSPIYKAHREGKKVFVYVDETRPRNQGAKLTAWELTQEGVPHAIVLDNAGAYLMSQGKVDLMLVGADRIAKNGDVANKIGTLEKALAAKEFGVPFFVAATSTTFDLNCNSGKDIPIEERSQEEVLYQMGLDESGKIKKILVCSPKSKAVNFGFDITSAKYIKGIITERGIIEPNEAAIKKLCRIRGLNSKIK